MTKLEFSGKYGIDTSVLYVILRSAGRPRRGTIDEEEMKALVRQEMEKKIAGLEKKIARAQGIIDRVS